MSISNKIMDAKDVNNLCKDSNGNLYYIKNYLRLYSLDFKNVSKN